MTEQETPAAPAEPAKKRGFGKIIMSVVGVIVVVAIIGVVKFGAREVFAFLTGDAAKAEVGDCINDANVAEDMKIVDCGGADAAFKVVGVVEDKTQTQADASCTEFAEADQYLFLYEESTLTETTKGRVICLAPNAK